MAVVCVVSPDDIPLCRVRGDTYADQFTIRSDTGVAVNITGFSFTLTVAPSDAPTDALGNLFQLTGTVTNGLGGVVEFAPSAIQADQLPGSYFYDIQMIDGGAAIRTIINGDYEISQDITK